MSNQRYERFRWVFGRYEIWMRGEDVILADPQLRVERNLTAQESLSLLTWLYSHRQDLHEVIRKNEQASKEE